MAKKGSLSSRKAAQTPEKNVAVGKDGLFSTMKKPVGVGKDKDCKKFGSEIDEIFSKKRKKLEIEEGKVAENKVAISNTKKKKKKSYDTDKPAKDIKGPLDMPGEQRKRTKDGLVVYSEEELGFGKSDAGGTSYT